MDLDAFAAVHRPQWERLRLLSRRRRLSGEQADELLRLYQGASAHLSLIRSVAPEGPLSASLSNTLARARTRFTGAPSNAMEDLGVFFAVALPLAFYRLRWLTLAIGAATALVALLVGAWVSGNPAVLHALAGDAALRTLVDHDFVGYYSANPAASFTGQVWTNNAWVAAQCVAFGITGVWVPYVLLQNALNLGLVGGVMVAYGRGDVFFSYIAPHGMLELTAVFVAAAAGLRIFWSWISPAPRPRLSALAREGRSLVTVALGLVPVLFVSGLVEGFVTPSSLPVPAKLGIGALALAAFWAYALIPGRRAAAAGLSADLPDRDAGDTVISA
ncbi:MAG: stage II sporulation protein M [Actinomycetales bacterium]